MPRGTVVSGLGTQIGMGDAAEGVLGAMSTGKAIELVRRRVSDAIEGGGGVSAVGSKGGEEMGRVIWVVMSIIEV